MKFLILILLFLITGSDLQSKPNGSDEDFEIVDGDVSTDESMSLTSSEDECSDREPDSDEKMSNTDDVDSRSVKQNNDTINDQNQSFISWICSFFSCCTKRK